MTMWPTEFQARAGRSEPQKVQPSVVKAATVAIVNRRRRARIVVMVS
jgi:hypothetical protein